ncbi:MAG: ammonium transporter [Opitutales bacterium]
MRFVKTPICVFLLTLIPFQLNAQETQVSLLEEFMQNADILWTLLAAALVFLMQAGFMCLESGMSRAKNSINVAVKNMMDLTIAVATFWLVGFGIMFGNNTEFMSGWFGWSHFMPSLDGEAWIAVFFVFQAVFVGTAATINSGAIAERTRFTFYLVITTVISALIYPVFGHWAWGSLLNGDAAAGWLESKGFLDFAGSTVVHSIGGWVALACVIAVGARIGRFDEKGNPKKIPAHSLVLAYLGTFILFFGWFGFNCGSTTSVTSDIAVIAANTLISGCFGALAGSVCSWIFHHRKKPEPESIANGAIAGLVGITAGCNVVGTEGAVIIGLVSGAVMYATTLILERVFKVDDVVGAIPAHGFAGAWGTIATGLFIKSEFLADGVSRWDQTGIQVMGVITAFVWGFGLTYVLLMVIKKFMPLRVDEEAERKGLNIVEHGATSGILDLATTMNAASTSGTYKLIDEIEHGTEVGDLSESFNEMVTAINDAMLEASKQLKEAQAAREQVDLQLEVADLAKATAEAAVQKSDGLLGEFEGYLAEHVEDISSVANKATDTLENTRGAANNVNVSVNEMGQDVGKTLQVAEDSTRDILETAGGVSERIGAVIDTIRTIAQKTTILALNAKIQAERAGEAGKGFGSVVEEIRSLSGQTESATEEIEKQVSAIQKLNLQLDKSLEFQNTSREQVQGRVEGANRLIDQLMENLSAVISEMQGINMRVSETQNHFKQSFREGAAS